MSGNPVIYKPFEWERLRIASQFNAQLMDHLRPYVKPGITTNEINQIVHDYTVSHGNTPATLGYMGYPKSCCISINEVVCHGIPDDTVLKEGDIVNVDITSIVNNWYGDQSETFLMGQVSDEARKLVQVTFDSLFLAINSLQPGSSVIQIGHVISDYAREAGFGVVRQYQGHGIGREFHTDPGIPHYPVSSSERDLLLPGMCFTIEPMLNAGSWKTVEDQSDGWTVRTKDNKLSAQFEHTILMTEDGPEILTLTKEGPQAGHQF
ncbi:MAG: type I methionyl aminopeptidase [Planctomycetes bacterium]|nr:type I methionyl aminopeptidase [Planctomycetota bacterium]MCH9778028.1 type I methionyl aminopeptidase [Planctomycetota bacterium]MCH9793017.1 type I methionyl aminopeptidase [Planctomycetota bacterium]MDF1743942.1 type I methionyl aminopeptidase [Gimesia sp.]